MSSSRKKWFLLAGAALGLAGSGFAAPDTWTLRDGYFQRDGRPIFLHGANYVGSTNWMLHLVRWNEDAVAADMRALRGLGVNCIRTFPLWSFVQPEPYRLDENILRRLDRIVALAGENGIAVQFSVLSGFVVPLFVPTWATGNIFTDPERIRAEQFLLRELSRRYRDNPHVQGFDFGNELNVLLASKLKLTATAEQVDAWMRAMRAACREGAPDKPVTNGIGTGYNSLWPVENQARSVDFLSIHYYPEFALALRYDPYLGQRSTYGVNCYAAWAAMGGKPVLVQEIGVPSGPMPDDDIAKYLRLTYLSSWADGAAGYLWWCSHNIDPAFRIAPHEFALGPNPSDRLPETETIMGLLQTDNRERAYAGAFRTCGQLVDRLGVGWRNQLPVCYIVAQTGAEQKATFPHYINPYVLAKQAHLAVRFLPEGAPVPADAAAVIVPCFSLTDGGRKTIGDYLAAGGVVYQSFANDFAPGLKLGDPAAPLLSPSLIVRTVAGRTSSGQHVRLSGPVRLRPVLEKRDVTTMMALGDSAPREPHERDQGVLFRAKIGRGTYYCLAADLEQALTATYEPWATDDAVAIYSLLAPATSPRLDAKFVELQHLRRGDRSLIVLLNHTDRFEVAILRTDTGQRLRNAETGADIVGSDGKFIFRLEPAEVLVLEVAR